MGKYNWSLSDLEQRRDELKKMYYRETDNTFREEIVEDITILDYEISKYYKDDFSDCNEKLLDKFAQFKYDISFVSFLINDFKEYYKYTNDKDIPIPKLKNLKLSNDELMELTYDFFKKIGHPFYGCFKEIYAQRKDHIKFSSYNNTRSCGCNIFLKTFRESFIDVKRFYTIDDATTLTHEIEHGIAGLMYPYFLYTPFCEVDTNTLEMQFLKYYYEEKKDSDVYYSQARRFNASICSATEIYMLIKLMEQEQKIGYNFTKNKELKYYGKEICNLDSNDLTELLRYYSTNMLLTLIGNMYAVEFNYLFNEDKGKSKNYLRQLITFDCKNFKDYYIKLKKFGIFPNQHINIYYNDLQQKVTTLSKGRKLY